MKDNTIFHFGNAEIKYSCYSKQLSNGKGKRKMRLFFSRVIAGVDRSEHIRVPTDVLVQYRNGFAGLDAALNWAASVWAKYAASEKRVHGRNFEPRTAHKEA